MMRKLSAMKDLERDILAPMRWIDNLTRDDSHGAVGQVTQLVVGAADESDSDILKRVDQLYTDWNLKRVYYSPFRHVRHTPLEEHPATPAIRGHRLYQMDWLRRVYNFPTEESLTGKVGLEWRGSSMFRPRWWSSGGCLRWRLKRIWAQSESLTRLTRQGTGPGKEISGQRLRFYRCSITKRTSVA